MAAQNGCEDRSVTKIPITAIQVDIFDAGAMVMPKCNVAHCTRIIANQKGRDTQFAC